MSELPSKRRQMVLLDPSLVKTKPLERAAKQVANAKVSIFTMHVIQIQTNRS